MEHHPHRPFPYFRGIPRSSVYRSILSKDGASGKVGVVQSMLGGMVSAFIAFYLAIALSLLLNVITGVEFEMPTSEISVVVIWLCVISAGIVTLCLYGYWRGRRQTLGAYMQYVLRKVTPSARDAIVELGPVNTNVVHR